MASQVRLGQVGLAGGSAVLTALRAAKGSEMSVKQNLRKAADHAEVILLHELYSIANGVCQAQDQACDESHS